MAAQDAQHPLWPQSWVEAAGEATIRARGAPKKIKLYCGWFCPFAQRGWIACEAKGIDYQYIEINPYKVDTSEPGGYTKRALPLARKQELFPEFVAVSPRGLVPAMDADGEFVWESMQLIEYIDERFAGPRLLPADPLARARVRIYVAHCADFIQKPYYTMLMVQDAAAREEAKDKMLEGCRALARAMGPEGPFFLGDTFSAFEIALAPFWQRYLWVGSTYRGLSFPADEEFKRLQLWWSAVEQHPAVAATLVCRDRLISSYSDYAENKGTSEYAKSIQAGLGGKTSPSSGASASASAHGVQSPSPLATGLVTLALGAVVGAAAAYRSLRK